METTNPYTTPQGELVDGSEEHGTINIFSASGRIGRIRYLAYGMGIGFAIYLVMALVIVAATVAAPESVLKSVLTGIMGLTMFVGVIALLVFNVLLTIQRCHDFNASGWVSLVLLLPFAPLIFWFVPGSRGANDYGPRPPPNSRGVVIVIVSLVAVMILVGILGAISVPIYDDYIRSAQELQQMQEGM